MSDDLLPPQQPQTSAERGLRLILTDHGMSCVVSPGIVGRRRVISNDRIPTRSREPSQVDTASSDAEIISITESSVGDYSSYHRCVWPLPFARFSVSLLCWTNPT